MLIVDVVTSPVAAPEPPPVLTREQLHAQVQEVLVDATVRYKYELGLSDAFERPIWKRLDRILRAQTQVEAEKLAAEAQEYGLGLISVWQKKVTK